MAMKEICENMSRYTAPIEEAEENGLEDESFYDNVDPARYKRLELIGMGNYASVYRARDLQEDKIVAIKYLRKLTPEEEKHLGKDELFEIKILSTLKHPNIINLVDSFGDSDQKSLVMECMDFTLENVIKDHTIKQFLPGQIKLYLTRIVEGLVYLHNEKIIHRDLKPNNVLLSRSGGIKISDFGASRRHIAESVWTNPFGCRCYRAPEILLGASTYNQTVDIWALGCLTAEFFTRKPLFVESCDIGQLRLICELLGPPKSEDFSEKLISGFQLKFSDKLKAKTLEAAIPRANILGLHLMKHCFIYNPDKRWTSKDCLKYLSEMEEEFPCCKEDELPIPREFARNHAVRTNCSRKRKRSFDNDSDHPDHPLTDLSFNLSDTESSPCKTNTGVKTPGGNNRLEKLRTPGKFQTKLQNSKVRRRLF